MPLPLQTAVTRSPLPSAAGTSAISETAPACPVPGQRENWPAAETPQPISSRLPLPLRTAVSTLAESTAAIVTTLTCPAAVPLSPSRDSVPSGSSRQQISSR